MHVVKDGDDPPKIPHAFIEKSIESRLLVVTGRWFSVITPLIFVPVLGYILTTIISNDKDLEVIKTRVVNSEARITLAEGTLGSLQDFIAQSRVAREKDLGELKQRISTLEAQSKTLLDSANRQEDKLDKIFDRLTNAAVR